MGEELGGRTEDGSCLWGQVQRDDTALASEAVVYICKLITLLTQKPGIFNLVVLDSF